MAEIKNNKVIVDTFDHELGMTEEEVDFRFKEAVRLAKEKSRIMGKPTCEFDRELMQPYILYPDGHREYPPFHDFAEDDERLPQNRRKKK